MEGLKRKVEQQETEKQEVENVSLIEYLAERYDISKTIEVKDNG